MNHSWLPPGQLTPPAPRFTPLLIFASHYAISPGYCHAMPFAADYFAAASFAIAMIFIADG
jgi:hypothetical protein